MERVILGSSSPWRQEVLKNAGWDYFPITSGLDEKLYRHPNPAALTRMLASEKALVVAQMADEKNRRENYIITSDQVAVHDRIILEKPESLHDVQMNLQICSIYPVKKVTAVCVFRREDRKWVTEVDVATVRFKPFSDEEVHQIIESGIAFSCSGSFVLGREPFDSHLLELQGAQDSVIGLPLEITTNLLASMRYPVAQLPSREAVLV